MGMLWACNCACLLFLTYLLLLCIPLMILISLSICIFAFFEHFKPFWSPFELISNSSNFLNFFNLFDLFQSLFGPFAFHLSFYYTHSSSFSLPSMVFPLLFIAFHLGFSFCTLPYSFCVLLLLLPHPPESVYFIFWLIPISFDSCITMFGIAFLIDLRFLRSYLSPFSNILYALITFAP
jgi:hypothetical protein